MARSGLSSFVVLVVALVASPLFLSSPGDIAITAQWVSDEAASATTYIPTADQQASPNAAPAVKGWAPSRVVGGSVGKQPLRSEAETRDVMMNIARDMNVDIDQEHIEDMAPLMKDLSTMIYHQNSSAELARHRTLLDRSMGQRAHQKLVKKLTKYFPDDTSDQLEERLYHMQRMIQDFAQKKPNASYMDVVTETAKRLDLQLEDVDMGQLQSHMKWMERVFKTLNPGAMGKLSEQKAEEL